MMGTINSSRRCGSSAIRVARSAARGPDRMGARLGGRKPLRMLATFGFGGPTHSITGSGRSRRGTMTCRPPRVLANVVQGSWRATTSFKLCDSASILISPARSIASGYYKAAPPGWNCSRTRAVPGRRRAAPGRPSAFFDAARRRRRGPPDGAVISIGGAARHVHGRTLCRAHSRPLDRRNVRVRGRSPAGEPARFAARRNWDRAAA